MLKLPNVLTYGSGWLAFDKPFNMSAHNADLGESDVITAVTEVLRNNQQLREAVNPEESFHPSPVHRLDVGTSGVIVVALTHKKAVSLSKAFSDERTQKIYQAVVKGHIEDVCEWAFPLTDKAEGRRNPAGTGLKKPCVTHVKPLSTTPYFSFLEVKIQSGRTHQIRRHSALAKHPIIGDTRYANKDYAAKIKELYKFDRLALHASKLVIEIDKVNFEIISPLPKSFDLLLNPI